MIKTPPPATLLLHGKEDTTIDPRQSVEFAEAIRAKGGKAEVILYDGQKHGFFNREPYLAITTQAMVTHVVSVLKH
jgi:acetyl esterase/lipase